MKIKDRLLMQFTVLFAILLLGVLTGIYFITDSNRKSEFRNRLTERATVVAQLFLAEDNLPSDKFKDIIKKYPQSIPGEIVRIYDSSDQPVFLRDSISHEWSRAIIHKVRSSGSIRYFDHNRQVVGILYQDNSGDSCVLISAVDQYGIKDMQQLFRVMLLFFLSSLLITLIIGHFFSRVALQPIKKMIRDIRIVRSTSLDQRLNESGGKDEISELIRSFNDMLEHLEQSFETQKQFVSNASHELRTPLTSIIGSLEVSLRAKRSEDDYRKTLETVLNETEHLNELLNSLLELAQATIVDEDRQDVRLDELMWQVKDEYAAHHEVELIYHLSADQHLYTFSCNRHLLFLAIGNILKNAIKFSDGKKVDCILTANNHKTSLIIRDYGIGINEKDREHIFRPFFRAANAKKYEGVGIGLSLSEKIFRLHNVLLTVRSQPGNGTDMIMEFPQH